MNDSEQIKAQWQYTAEQVIKNLSMHNRVLWSLIQKQAERIQELDERLAAVEQMLDDELPY